MARSASYGSGRVPHLAATGLPAVSATASRGRLYPALLKHWRRQRGLSQLDLSLLAGVSARHLSFLETGRSVPSPEMVVQLASTLGVPLAQTNEMLRACGHDPVFDEPDTAIPADLAHPLAMLKQHQEPYPLIVLDRCYEVLDVNQGALAVLGAVLGELGSPSGLNLARATFDPAGAQPVIANFSEVGRQLLWRIQREVLADPGDARLGELLEDLLAAPTVAPDWREPDLGEVSGPALVLHLRRDGIELRFLTLVTMLQAPQHVAAEQLRIESWFPFDDATDRFCHQVAAAPG